VLYRTVYGCIGVYSKLCIGVYRVMYWDV